MGMNYLSYLPRTVSQNDLVVKSHTFVAAVVIILSVYLKAVLITMTEMKINWSNFHIIITTVSRWMIMKKDQIYTSMVGRKWGRNGFTFC